MSSSTSGALGRVLHADVRYWCDYAADPQGPISWRYQGAPGSGALADVGSHAAYLAEFLCGDVQSVSGGRFATAITERPVPLGAVIGHGQVAVSDQLEPVENDDYAASARSSRGASASCRCPGWPRATRTGSRWRSSATEGAAKWEQERPPSSS